MAVIDGRQTDLGGGMMIHRILPSRLQRMVGPFIFLDHIGPVQIAAGQKTDVRPHPHIGLSTLTYLFEGRQVHRDSLGIEQVIVPGDVNWMTAGRGIAHSERAVPEDRSQERSFHGLQFWVALPDETEDQDPSFVHYPKSQIPELVFSEYSAQIIVGKFNGTSSPVKPSSEMVFVNFKTNTKCKIQFEYPEFELGVYLISGEIKVKDLELKTHQMKTFTESGEVEASAGAHFILIGGRSFQTTRHIFWNFVSSSPEKIEAAKAAWKNRTFPQVPGESEFVPLPEK